MNKAQKLQAAAELADAILDMDVSDDVVEAINAPVKAVKAPKAKPAKAKKAEVKVEAKKEAKPVKAEADIGLTIREITVLKAVAASDFANEDGAVPSITLAVDCAESVPVGAKKVNSPIPGLVASLQKKGVFDTFKLKGQTMVALSAVGKDFLTQLA